MQNILTIDDVCVFHNTQTNLDKIFFNGHAYNVRKDNQVVMKQIEFDTLFVSQNKFLFVNMDKNLSQDVVSGVDLMIDRIECHSFDFEGARMQN